jgi:hypothetical protein
MWHNAKRRSNKSEAKVTIDVNWIEARLKLGVCELTGLQFDLSSTSKFSSNPYAPSLDKIDSKIKDYTPENTRIVLAAVNTALNEYGEVVLFPILKSLLKAIEIRSCL